MRHFKDLTTLPHLHLMQTVSSNAEGLKQLCDVIEQVRDSVLEPLQKWTGEVPSELENLIRDFLAYASHVRLILVHSL